MTTKNSINLAYLRSIKAIVWLQGREYLTHNGLLRVAHEHGLKSITSDLVHWDAEGRQAVVKATVFGERGTFTGYGDASPGNVARHLKEATLRMAETRAVNRALRLYTGLGMTTAEELPGDQDDAPPPPAPRAQPIPPRPADLMPNPVTLCAACSRHQDPLVMLDDHGFCNEHAEQWRVPEDPSWDAAHVEWPALLEPLGIDPEALDLRCTASPHWKARPAQMTVEERGRLLEVLKQHNDRKRGAAR